MKCSSCPYTDNLVYTSNPPQVKCSITGKFHYYDDECDCVLNAAESVKINIPKEDIDLEKLREILETPIMSPSAVAYSTSCIICGSEIAVDLCENHTKVCDDCKRAIKFIKEHFRYED
jgi:hypothetical protein